MRLGMAQTTVVHASAYDPSVIFITAKFRVRAEHADRWPEITREFTEATRAEAGCLWFDWSLLGELAVD